MLESYCKSRNIKNYYFYIDGGYSGSNLNRPEIQRLIDEAKQNKISHVIVYKLDRLSRSQKDTLYLIEDVFLKNDISFISINESFDTSTPFGRAMIGILSVFAQLERENIRERTRMGMKERIKNGYWMGGGKIPFGYDYDPKQGILVPNKDAEKVRAIYDLYLQGYSLQKIAVMLGLKYDKLAQQILLRKSNAGYIYYNGEEYLGKHEPIIPLETYEKAVALFKAKSKNHAQSTYLLTGLLYCAKCGAKMRHQKWGKYGTKLVCYSQQLSKPYLVKDPNCDNEKVWADEIEEAVISNLFNFSQKQVISEEEELKTYNDVIDILVQQINAQKNKLKKLYELYALGDDDVLISSIKDTKNEIKKLEEQLEIEKTKQTLTKNISNVKLKIKNLSETWEYMTMQEKQTIARTLIDKIFINGNNIEIEYKF